MKLDESIEALLHEHDCVIIPRFGGFVANYKPAHIHPRMKVICPPSKSISFNRQLVRNDGLLANYISEREEISYDAALAFIDTSVNTYQQELELGQRLEIERVGSIYLDENGLMQFIPDSKTNFLASSFGLPNIPLPEIEKEETPVIPITQELEEEIKTTPWWVGAASIALPLALMSLFFFKDAFNGSSNLELANLNPLNSLEKVSRFNPEEERPESVYLISEDEVGTLEHIIAEAPAETTTFNYDFIEGNTSEDGITIRLKDDPIPDISASSLNLYFVIAGAFENKSNADGLVDDLQGKGFDAALIGKRGRLHLVSYGAYTSRRAAKKALREIQADQHEGWIYKK